MKGRFKPLLEFSRFDNRFMELNSFELYSSVELLLADRYEPPIVLGSRDCNGARLLEDVSPESFEFRCALLIALVVLADEVPGARSSSCVKKSRGLMVLVLFSKVLYCR